MEEVSNNIALEAYVTLVTNDAYVIGALVLGHSLRRQHTRRNLVCMITKDVSYGKRTALKDVFDYVPLVEEIDSKDPVHLALLARPELGVTFTKLNAWTLTKYSKCVFLDADTLVLQSIDSVFERDVDFAAAPDVGWPDCFNSGVFLYHPSMDTYKSLLDFASQKGSFDGGDQGLLNSFYSHWSTGSSAGRLPFTHNMTANASYGYAPAYAKFKEDVHVVHFIGSFKPWHGIPQPGPNMHSIITLVEQWWRIHDDYQLSCSESCPYKTLMDVRSRSPGPEAEANLSSPDFHRMRSGSGSHDHAHPIQGDDSDPNAYLKSSSFDQIQQLLDSSMEVNRPTQRSRSSSIHSQKSEHENDDTAQVISAAAAAMAAALPQSPQRQDNKEKK